MSIATVAAQQTANTATTTGQNALSSLSGNFQDFLKMLMTQLQNQDPTTPLDTNQFTTELVQFSGVEQQINTNNSLTQLIQLTQGGEVMQASSMTGKSVTVTANQIPLQNGSGSVSFTAPSAETAKITITDQNGRVVRVAAMNAAAGQNTWTWDGTSSSGSSLPDGTYGVSVTGYAADGTGTALTTNVTGTATGVQSSANNGVQLMLGSMAAPFSSIVSVGG